MRRSEINLSNLNNHTAVSEILASQQSCLSNVSDLVVFTGVLEENNLVQEIVSSRKTFLCVGMK